MQNKRGQGLSTQAIILIVLGVAVLVIMIIGFTVGWDKLAPWLSRENVNSIVTQCEVACSTQSVYDFCTKTRELKASDLPGGVKSVTKTCLFFSTYKNVDGETYGIAECSGLCPAPLQTCDELQGTLVTLDGDVTDCVGQTTKVSSSDTTDTIICCIASE